MFTILFNGHITTCKLKKRLISAAFWVLLQAMFMNDWKQTAQQERQQTVNKRNIIRWNIYRDNLIFTHEDKYFNALKIVSKNLL